MTLFALDTAIYRAIHVDGHRDWLDWIAMLITNSGLGAVKFACLVPFLIWTRTRKSAMVIAIAGLASALIRLPFMKLIGRMRPSNYIWANPLENIYSHESSFPSGHTTTTFAVAIAFWLVVRRTEYAWVGWIGWIWAALVGLSRIYVGVHYPSDVLAGAILGVIVGGLVAEWLLNRQAQLQSVSIGDDQESRDSPTA